MSQEIDQRVVEMRFDNAQFEKNSRDTMRTSSPLQPCSASRTRG